MKNKILVITQHSVAYVKELRPLTGSVIGCILMQQLDYWFNQKPDGFYKFLEPCKHRSYKPGDSWIEELAFSKSEFRTAFSQIGAVYKSKSQFEAAKDKFQGKFYCSYHDRINGLTWYFRNHAVVDQALDTIVYAQEKDVINDRIRDQKGRFSQPVVDISRKSTNLIYGNKDHGFTEIKFVDLDLYTETTNKDYLAETTYSTPTGYFISDESLESESENSLCDRDSSKNEGIAIGGESSNRNSGEKSKRSTCPVAKPEVIEEDQIRPAKLPRDKNQDKRFLLDKDGWLQLPRHREFAIARKIAVTRMQIWLATEWLEDVSVVTDENDNPVYENGRILLYSEKNGQASEDEMFSPGDMSLKALRTYACAHENLTAEEFNSTLKYFFLDTCQWCDRVGRDTALKLINSGSIVATFDDAELLKQSA